MLNAPIPYDYIRTKTVLTWPEALWGYERQMIGWHTLVALAEDALANGSGNTLEVEMAGLTKSEAQRAGELARELAGQQDVSDSEESPRKWLYLALAWIYENRDAVTDPLGHVERIYADFEYPEEMSGFVRYMPPDDGYDPTRHSLEENEKRLLDRWREYLRKEEEEEEFGSRA